MHWIERVTRLDLLVLIYFIACICMIFSPFVLSVTMWLIPALGLFAYTHGQTWYIPRLSERVLSLQPLAPENRPFLLLTGLFLIILLSAFQTEDWSYWWERLRIRLPFLVLGLSGMMLPGLPQRRLHAILALLLAFMTLVCLGVGINYLMHADTIQDAMVRGHSIPVPRNHIRFSLLLAMSILGGIELIRTRSTYRWSWERKAIIAGTLFLVFMLHFLSVRTGMLAFYGGTILYGFWIGFRTGKAWIPLLLIAGFASLIWGGYHFLPSMKSKIDYMRYDLAMYRQGEGGQYADSGRIVSLKTGLKIFSSHPWIGIGVGNLRQEVNRIFEEDYPDYTEPLTPHNQFIYVLAGTGIVGLGLFLIFFFSPLWFNGNFKAPLLLSFYGLVGTAFMLEHTIENSIGTGFVSLFLVLLLLRQRDANSGGEEVRR